MGKVQCPKCEYMGSDAAGVCKVCGAALMDRSLDENSFSTCNLCSSQDLSKWQPLSGQGEMGSAGLPISLFGKKSGMFKRKSTMLFGKTCFRCGNVMIRAAYPDQLR